MKRLLTLLCLVVLCTTLFACSSPMDVENQNPTPQVNTTRNTSGNLQVVVGNQSIQRPIQNQTQTNTTPTPNAPPQSTGAQFTIDSVLSFGYINGNDYKHDFLRINITAQQDFDINDLTISSSLKGITYDGKFATGVACNARELVAARKVNKFSVEGPLSTDKGDTVTLCLPTVITMVRNEQQIMTFSLENKDIYTVRIKYPSVIQSTVIDMTDNAEINKVS